MLWPCYSSQLPRWLKHPIACCSCATSSTFPRAVPFAVCARKQPWFAGWSPPYGPCENSWHWYACETIDLIFVNCAYLPRLTPVFTGFTDNPSEQFLKLNFSKCNWWFAAGSKGAPRPPGVALLLWESGLCREAPFLPHSSLVFIFVLMKYSRSVTVCAFPS